ncbi:MAG: SIMPL domain-containing protein [Defluviitaleaceae bacterium]|nr:SIMPL domain-containing protein [Defluviitaleaceae bacterium]
MKKFKKAALSLSGVVMAAVIAAGLMNTGLFRGANTAYADTTDMGQINVSGAGSINVDPDVAYVSLGVSTQDASPKAALDANNKLIAAVIAAVKKAGIADKDIRTDGFSMYPNYDYSKSTQVVTGYAVSNNVNVTIRDITKVGDVLGVATDAGANVAGSVQFSVLDSSAAYNQALAMAIDNAKGKAQTIAKALGITIGVPASVTETNNGYATPMYTAALNSASADAGGSVPVQTGKLTITANVAVTYEYAK